MPGTVYEQIETNKSLKAIGDEVLQYWKEAGIIEKSLNSSLGNKPFTFLEGPPTANGRPHVGHAMTRTVKDSVLRYRYMTGHRISRRTGGWDCHGLPVEIEAEKHFGFKVKKEIEEFGIDKFNEYCRESIFRYIDEWMETDDHLGYWVDQENAYVTMRNEYMESEWWALKTMFEKKMLVRDFKIVPYCPRCETSLSSHELSQGYDDAKDPSVYVKFREKGYSDRYFMAWTTTPWTLPANQFLAVNEKIEYALVQVGEEEYYVARPVVEKLFGKEARILSTMAGSDLVGKQYEQLMDFIPAPKGSLVVTSGDHVTVEDGTGIVHTSPAFGADDFEIGKRFGVEIINPINQSGRFNDPRLPWNGKFFKDADTEILIWLKTHNKVYRSEKITHTYPFCYRCGTPLLYYPLQAWFIRVSTIRQKLLENNARIDWHPEHLKDGRFGNFLTEAKDWALSRNRYWGTPLPVWTCPEEHMVAVGSVEELKQYGGSAPDDLHRPFIDNVRFPCPTCGKEMTREPYVIDTWFDSGSATYAAIHYPMESGRVPLPISFITEAIDQTRGWFYTLHVIGSILFDTNAYKDVLSIDFILDEQGRKMSKSKGNSVYAIDFVNEFGPDPARLFFMTGVPWRSKAIDRKLISEITRKVFGTLSNVYSFFASNANLDSYRYEGLMPGSNILDRWIISRCNSTVEAVKVAMDNYDMHIALKAIEDLIEDLSNFYLRLSRRRFWAETLDRQKEEAYSVLFYALETVTLMLAPLAPFYSEYLYRKLHPESESVHLEKFPEAMGQMINHDLEAEVSRAEAILEATRRIRQDHGIKGRQPVTEVLVSSTTEIGNELLEIISPELNARTVRFVDENEWPVVRKIALKTKEAAPLLRKDLNMVREALDHDDGTLALQFSSAGSVKVGEHAITGEIAEIFMEPKAEYAMDHESKSGITVFVNLRRDQALMNEGLARELVRRIQVMRKEMNLQYDETIDVTISGPDGIRDQLAGHAEWMGKETLASTLQFASGIEGRKWDIDGEIFIIRIVPTETVK